MELSPGSNCVTSAKFAHPEERLIIPPSSQGVCEDKSEGLAECLACGEHSLHAIVIFIILWYIPLQILFLTKTLPSGLTAVF
jgi:hypothetical protein